MRNYIFDLILMVFIFTGTAMFVIWGNGLSPYAKFIACVMIFGGISIRYVVLLAETLVAMIRNSK